MLAGAIGGWSVEAGAAPTPTVAQVQAKINQLTSQFDQVSQQLDQGSEQLSSAQQQLKQVTTRWNQAHAQFKAAQTAMAQIAASAYEDTGSTSISGLLTSDDPAAVLQQGSLVLEVASQQDAQARQFLQTASELAGVEQQMQRTETGVAQLNQELTAHKAALQK